MTGVVLSVCLLSVCLSLTAGSSRRSFSAAGSVSAVRRKRVALELAMSLVVWRRTPGENEKEKSLPTTNPLADQAFMVPEMGRRKRRLVQNPSGLQF